MIIRSTQPKYVSSKVNKTGMYNYANKFAGLVQDIQEATGFNLYDEPKRVLNTTMGREMMKDFFIEESFDPNQFSSVEEMADYKEEMALQFDNDVKGITEHVTTGDMNPLIGMSTTMHKQILMNMVYDKGAIQKVVFDQPAVTITQQYRYLIDTEGNKIDMFREQNKMTDAINRSNPIKIIDVNLPETGTTNFVDALDGTSRDHLSVLTKIVAFKIPNVVYEKNDHLPDEDGYYDPNGKVATEIKTVRDTWFRSTIELTPTYSSNDGDRIAVKNLGATVKLEVPKNPDTPQDGQKKIETVTVEDVITAQYIKDKDRFVISAAGGKITGVRLKARLDASAGTINTCYTKWETKTIYEQVPDAIPINTTFSPDELKDIQAFYKVDQLSETMGQIKTVLLNYKDDTIKRELDDSYDNLPERSKAFGQYDYCPPERYASDHVAWIQNTFYFYFDSFITHLYQIYNDPNLTVSIFGDPDMVRKVVPTEVVYNSPDKIGPVELNFFKKTSTNGNRMYQWIGSDKNRGEKEFVIVLTPTNDNKRITYRIIDYMMYIGNEVRNTRNVELPSIHAYERWKFSEYEPVQARLEILNPSGMKKEK